MPPCALPQTVDQLKVSWVGVTWQWAMVVRVGIVELGALARMGATDSVAFQDSTERFLHTPPQ